MYGGIVLTNQSDALRSEAMAPEETTGTFRDSVNCNSALEAPLQPSPRTNGGDHAYWLNSVRAVPEAEAVGMVHFKRIAMHTCLSLHCHIQPNTAQNAPISTPAAYNARLTSIALRVFHGQL